mgnify:CR=1 FL=1
MWQAVLKSELVSPEIKVNVGTAVKDSHNCCEDIKAELVVSRQSGNEEDWIAWYINSLDGAIEDMSCLEIKRFLEWAIEESQANAYIHDKASIDHSRSKAGGPIFYEKEVKPKNKEHEVANPFFTTLLTQFEKDCPSLEMDDEKNTTTNYPKWSSTIKSWITILRRRNI